MPNWTDACVPNPTHSFGHDRGLSEFAENPLKLPGLVMSKVTDAQQSIYSCLRRKYVFKSRSCNAQQYNDLLRMPKRRILVEFEESDTSSDAKRQKKFAVSTQYPSSTSIIFSTCLELKSSRS